MDICFTHHNIQRCESDNGYPENIKMVAQLLIDTVSANFVGLASVSAETRKIKLSAYSLPSVFLLPGDDGA